MSQRNIKIPSRIKALFEEAKNKIMTRYNQDKRQVGFVWHKL
jgi:hypothetical protein